jgi:hypothetical protein
MHTVQLNKLRFPEVIFNDLLVSREQETGNRGTGEQGNRGTDECPTD